MAIQLLDFNVSVPQLRYDVLHIVDDYKDSPEVVLVDVYRGLIKARHDTLHYFCHDFLGLPWVPESKIGELFGFLPQNMYNKTPDTILKDGDIYWVIDYSISVDVHRISKLKHEKYDPIIDEINKHGYKCVFTHINVKANFSNLETELLRLNHLRKKEFEFAYFMEICSALDEHKIKIGNRINPDHLDIVKEAFRDEDDEFMETSVGFYKDLDLDVEGFVRFNEKFEHMDWVEKCVKDLDIDLVEKELYNILENEDDPIHQKYMDKKLNDKQFISAYEEIVQRNLDSPKTSPRPSHHMLVPLPTDIVIEGEIMNEQESILSFAKDFDHFFARNGDNQHPRLAFLGSVFHSLIKCSTGKDSEIYKKLYDGRTESIKVFINEFKEIKKARFYYSLFHACVKNVKDIKRIIPLVRAGNLPNTLPQLKIPYKSIIAQGIDIQKNDNRAYWEYYVKAYKILDEYKGINTLTDFLHYKGLLKEDPKEKNSFIIGDKKMRMPKDKQPQLVRAAMEKAGIKANVDEKDRKPMQDRGTIPIDGWRIMDDLMEYLVTGKNDPMDYKVYDLLTQKPSRSDSDTSKRLKKESIFDYTIYLDKIMETNAYKYSFFVQQAYNQLFHVNEYKSDNDTLYMYNMGISNFCCIVALTRADREGKPFICVVKTKQPDLYTDFWGKLNKVKVPFTNYWYIYTNWRRLDNNKVTYLRDVHYSVLSSTMNSAMSNPMALKYAIGDRIKRLYTFRVMVGLSANQKTSELLLDTRYAYMSSLSWYTDLGKLLVEKFGYQFNSIIEAWIIWRIITRLREINASAKSGGIVNYRLNIDLKTRDIQSIGGQIQMPSLWLDYDLTDITELLDEAFVYVHTIKEPANIFHEQIKAIQTIIKFQDEYDGLSLQEKEGYISNTEQLRKFLLRKGHVGCCTSIIYHSVTRNLKVENPNYKRFVHEIASESIGELLSTKAVISDQNREVVESRKINKRELKKMVKRQKDVLCLDSEPKEVEFKNLRLKVSSRFYSDYKPRQKVWETIMEYLEQDKSMERTVHLANYFLKEPMVIADICIKSQYGGKREFYVINITAKALARLTEVFFRKISQNSENEAISIPGDKKVMKMQRMLDVVHTIHKTENHDIIYTNGDCTKWSAAETMPSFIAMTRAFKENIPPGMYNVLLATFNAWSNKKIQIPMEIYNKVVPCKDYNTDYLNKLKSKNVPQIVSTQNFLQGMFNYSSSYKAVCCNNYTYTLWKKLYPESDLKIEHLEHSDDYVTICLYSNIKEFEKYRLLNKIMMRLHGYNDSERKTCSQPYIMEFVSQMSHNGVMLYPQIKKSKEVNLSLPCTGYTKDMEAAMSRVGECHRVGCNLSFLYFFQRLHTIVVAEAYSILPGMRNNMNRSFRELLSEPVELFGIPDPHPIFSLYCRGDVNNYRLYKYGDECTKVKLRKLYKKSLFISSVEGVTVEKEDDRYCLASPRFLYDMGNKTLIKLKKNINIPIEDVKNFWEKHPVYKLLKPKSNEMLTTWVKSMFYNRTFMEAYSTTSRAMMTMRIPKYVSKPMIVEAVDLSKHYENPYKWDTKIVTMKEYYEGISAQMSSAVLNWSHEDEVHLTRIITKCDPTVTQIYSILDTLTITLTEMSRRQTIQVSANQPRKTTTITLVNDPAILLQYILDYDCFIKDKRRVLSRNSLERDVLTIMEKYGDELNCKNTMALLSVYNDLMITNHKQNVVYTYDRHCSSLLDFIMASFRNNYHPGYICKVTHTNVGSILDPTTLKKLFLKQHRHTKDYHRQCLDNICLIHVFLTQTQNLSKFKSIEVLSKIKFQMFDDQILNYKEILKNITSDYMLLNDFTLTERKIAAYMKAYYLNDYTLLDELVNNHYSFSYRYNQEAFKRGDDYVGQTIVTYCHFNTMVKAYHDQKLGDPLIVMQKHYPTASVSLYNIALRLTHCISQNTYEESPNIDRRMTILGSEIKNKIKDMKIPNISHVVLPGLKDCDKIIKIHKIKDFEYYYPILITQVTIRRGGEHHFSTQKAQPHMEDKNLTIMLGKSRLFVLPYWRCNQYDNMSLDEIVVNKVPMTFMVKQRRIEYYLLSIHKLRLNTTTDGFDYWPHELILELKKHIMTQKIYDFNFTSILKNTGNLCELLSSTGKGKIEGDFIVKVKKDPLPDIPKEMEPEMEFGEFGFSFGNFTMNSLVELSEEDTPVYFDGEEETYSVYDNEFKQDSPIRDDGFIINFEDEEIMGGQTIDDTKDTLGDGLNYHLKEYINEDIIHKELYNKVMDDKFIVDPRTRGRTQGNLKKKEYEFYSKMGSNYMVLRLKKIPNLYVVLSMMTLRVPINSDMMNIYSFRRNLQKLVDTWQQNGLNEMEKICVLMGLEKMLCRTYLTDQPNRKQIVGFAYDTDNNMHLGVWVDTKGKLSMEKMNEALSQGKVLALDDKYMLVRTDIDRFEKEVSEGIDTGNLTMQPLLISIKMDKTLKSIYKKSKGTKTDDLLNAFL